jgi:hypothetical protein
MNKRPSPRVIAKQYSAEQRANYDLAIARAFELDRIEMDREQVLLRQHPEIGVRMLRGQRMFFFMRDGWMIQEDNLAALVARK